MCHSEQHIYFPNEPRNVFGMAACPSISFLIEVGPSFKFHMGFMICPLHRGWSGGAKVSCILCHRGVQLILAYSWARPAILVAGKG